MGMTSFTIHNIIMVPPNFIYMMEMMDQATCFFAFFMKKNVLHCWFIISGCCEERWSEIRSSQIINNLLKHFSDWLSISWPFLLRLFCPSKVLHWKFLHLLLICHSTSYFKKSVFKKESILEQCSSPWPVAGFFSELAPDPSTTSQAIIQLLCSCYHAIDSSNHL